MTVQQTPSAEYIAAVKKAALAADLHPDHEKSLQSMGTGLLRPAIPDDHASALISNGLARQSVGGLMLTDAGAFRVFGGGTE